MSTILAKRNLPSSSYRARGEEEETDTHTRDTPSTVLGTMGGGVDANGRPYPTEWQPAEDMIGDPESDLPQHDGTSSSVLATLNSKKSHVCQYVPVKRIEPLQANYEARCPMCDLSDLKDKRTRTMT